ncbi:MAG: glycerophosphoryl diester phosphodiesterase membrane domain-containing protein [Anaerolineae bacterium]|nr:glycerophosphoryl diester phosphodiesterase membrane domain-containing protein [Anaerolineae bacterium]
MTTTTVPKLRPLTIPRLLDEAVRLYRNNFLKFIGIIAIVQIPLTLFQMVVSLIAFGDFFATLESVGGPGGATPDEIFGPSYFTGIGASSLLGILGFILIQGVATAALTLAIAGSYLGEDIGILEAYQRLGRSWLSLIGALILAGIFGIALFIWFLIPCVGWITGLGMLAFYWAIVVPLIPPVIVLEKQAATQSIRRAWDLARRKFWWVIGFVLALFMFNQITVTAPTTLVTFISQLIFGDPLAPTSAQLTIQTIIQSITTLLFSLIYLPLQLTAITLMYFDLRIQTEGFDMDVLSMGFMGERTDVAQLVSQAPGVQQGNWFTINEMGYFVLLELGAVALLMAFYFLLALIGFLFFALMAASGDFG